MEESNRASNLKDSRISSRPSAAVTYVNKSPYGMADTDEVDEDMAGLIADKTPQTQRRIIQ